METEEELRAWRDYLVAQGVACTEVLERSFAKSVYLRDPDGHIVELATGAGHDGVIRLPADHPAQWRQATESARAGATRPFRV